MARPGVHHVDVVVSSLERSLGFYRELLGPLGYTRAGTIVGERGETVWYLGGSGGAAIGLREALVDDDVEVDRYRVGLHHLAIAAPSREAVEERAEWLRRSGATLESEPQEYE
jgi:catechol 2,3-dioxygenase-like lactoylglutathione lyase family enzyme